MDKELEQQVSRMIIECRSQDGQIDEWGERELRDDILALITSEKNKLLEELLGEAIYGHLAVPNCTEFVPVDSIKRRISDGSN